MATWSKLFTNFAWKNRPDTSTPLGQTLLNRLNNAINGIDDRVVTLNNEKASADDLSGSIVNVSLNSSTGVFTFTKYDGTTFTINTALEEVVTNFVYDNATQQLILTLADGTTQNVDLSALITQYEFTNSATILWTVTQEGKVVANIKPNSITDQMLQTNYLSDITTQANTAVSASQSALESQSLAEQSAEEADRHADRAEAAAERAESVSDVEIATTQKAGIVKPDGTTITVDSDGTIHGNASVTVDTELDADSTNPIANKAVAEALENVDAKTLDGHGASYFATDSDLIVERERISNLARLNEGSTTGDAELIDIRVGEDGVTYNSAGEAVRTQFSIVKSDLSELSSTITNTITLSATKTGGIYKTGQIDSSLSAFVYGEIDVANLRGAMVKITCSFYATVGFAVFDSVGACLMGVNGADYGSDDFAPRDYTFTMPENASKIRYTLGKNYSEVGGLSFAECYSANFMNIVHREITIDDYEVVDGEYVVATTGGMSGNASYSRSGYVDVSRYVGMKATVTSYLVSNAGIAFYDKFEAYISGIQTSNVNGGLFEIVCDIPENACYVAITMLNSISNSAKDYPITIQPEVANFVDSRTLDNERLAIPFSLFTKVGVIGDSFASGEIMPTGRDYYSLSWLQILARKNGFTGTNYSRGGLTTRTWLTDAKGLTLLNSSEAEQLYIIALGLNDAGSLGTSYLGTINDMKTDYTENPDTFYGNYGKILGSIKAKAPNAKIVLSTMPRDYGTFKTFNDAIRNIANAFGIPVVDINSDYVINSKRYTDTFLSSHPTATGYGMMANAYERMLSEVMMNYNNYFSDFVG